MYSQDLVKSKQLETITGISNIKTQLHYGAIDLKSHHKLLKVGWSLDL